ncbi:Sulfur carrier protein ThiS adenylyltransferase [Dickeya dianthicola]|uniref:HesA/MoeB/ThiF family protein n=7 Tax=Dickeya dianthicola TaxID=204039 RepID=A0ABX9NSY6_9GAMM|nr:HesA/MoeB/ThiF family protein [Dickeya dianthicola]AYC17159.1 Sulfur carrier protein ThiS adenylyltransferase [Dickeya dianthicola]MBI0439322.1 HesA/MoeB/ThiF family protein [Dickeya dianthicola]MBI0458367.1 HesA/MoeB/ThiF family protein [Dickeya dianthicola]MBI0467515.1 HesA/MoeB/ThiF family protein [Dickeya dianthicola]MBI0480008.1 HesA/MoeB/ThiF family protein [Dickeya dianthicola]
MLDDQAFMRYSRQLLLEDIAQEGQQKLAASRVLLVGLGGLGSPAALYLAAAGVGTLLLADHDTLHISNLQRQILYRSTDLARPKAVLARHALEAINPLVTTVALTTRLAGASLENAVAQADLVLDCCDNMATRHAVNAACVAAQKPLISASAVGFSGQLLVLTPPYPHGCYACLYPDASEPQRNCRTAGVLGPVVGVMGTLQALEAIKLLCGLPSPLDGKLRLFDARQQQWTTLQLTRSLACPVCGGQA